jgi:hypothetical protein
LNHWLPIEIHPTTNKYGQSPANKNNQNTESTSKRTPVQAVQCSGMAKKKKITKIRAGTRIKKKDKKKRRKIVSSRTYINDKILGMGIGNS